jgi:hypothetical protein
MLFIDFYGVLFINHLYYTNKLNYKLLCVSARDELIVKYTADLKNKCGVSANMDLLIKVTVSCGLSVYNKHSSTVTGGQQLELDTVKNNF